MNGEVFILDASYVGNALSLDPFERMRATDSNVSIPSRVSVEIDGLFLSPYFRGLLTEISEVDKRFSGNGALHDEDLSGADTQLLEIAMYHTDPNRGNSSHVYVLTDDRALEYSIVSRGNGRVTVLRSTDEFP